MNLLGFVAPGAGEAAEATIERSRYWPALDGLRGLAVPCVMTYHLGTTVLGPHFPAGGYLTVDVFFVLSGFLITTLLLAEHDRRGVLSFRRFYARRALRLFPALAAVVVFALFLGLYGQPFWRHYTLSGLPYVVLYVGNWARAFGSPDTLGALGQTWTLAIEEQFYLVWPLVLTLVLARTGRRRAVAVVLGGLGLAEMVYRFALLHAGVSLNEVYNRLDTHSDGLLIGAALAFYYSARLGSRLSRREAPAIRAGSAVGSAALVALILVCPADDFGIGVATPLAVLATAAVIWSIVACPLRPVSLVLECRAAVWTGERAYGLYLWHYPLYFLITAGFPGASAVRLAVSFAVAAASYRFIEAPFLRLKDRFAQVPGRSVERPAASGGVS